MFAAFFIDRPVFAIVLSIFTVLVGGLAYTSLPVAQYPDVVPPQIVVTAIYPGANAKTVSETVAATIEQEVNGVERMLYMESICTNDGAMRLVITFSLGTDIDLAQVLVQNRVAIALPRLPEEVRTLGVTTKKQSSSITLAVNFTSQVNPQTGQLYHDQLALSNFATQQIKDTLARVNGVGDVTGLGLRDYSMRIWIDPNRLTSLGLTGMDIVTAIREQNLQVAAGQIGQPPAPSGQAFQLTINTKGRLITEEEFGNIIVKSGAQGQILHLRDVARVELGSKSYDTSCYVNGNPAVTLAIFQLPGSNALETADLVRLKMVELQDRFPQGMEWAVTYDPTQFVRASVDAVIHTLIEAIVLVFVVVMVFLQNWRSALIPMLAVPVALVGTFAAMAALGYSLNNLTLFGLVLAIGIVVDDAIVVVEAVEFHMEHGLSPKEATKKAMEEVSGAIVGVTLVLSTVFIPCAFISGITGQFFKQFALTIAISTVISGFNSLTLSPALCPLLLRPKHAKKDPLTWLLDIVLGWFFYLFNKFFTFATNIYGWQVKWLMRLSLIVLVIYGGLLFLTYKTFLAVPTGFLPQQDQGYLVVNCQLPDSASLERTEQVMKRCTEIALQVPGVSDVIAVPGYSIFTGSNQSNVGGMYVSLKPFNDRLDPSLHVNRIIQELTKEYSKVQDGIVLAFGAPPILGLGNAGGFKLQVQDLSGLGLTELQASTGRLIEQANAQPGFVGVFSSFRASTPQLYIEIDREKAKSMGIPLTDVFDTLQIYLGSKYVNDLTLSNRNYQVNIQGDSEFRDRLEKIDLLRLRNSEGQMVPLSTFLKITQDDGPARVNRYNMFPAAEVNGNLLPFVSSGQAVEIMDRLALQELPQGMSKEWTEITLQQILAGNTALIVFAMSVVFVFLVLAAQYESWLLPLAIVLIVPMCLLCAVIGVNIAQFDMNIFTQIGLVVLVGLACKNAILIVEYAKQKQEQGIPRLEAALQAAKQRLRPILMTSFAFILGVVPLVVAVGAGAEMRRMLGTAVFSGMIGVTVFGIFFTPVFYNVFQWIADLRSKPEVEHQHATAQKHG